MKTPASTGRLKKSITVSALTKKAYHITQVVNGQVVNPWNKQSNPNGQI
jgi:hypothetical protein